MRRLFLYRALKRLPAVGFCLFVVFATHAQHDVNFQEFASAALGVNTRFQVSQGTWMSLDVSPDGKTIIFDLLGDLYVLPAGGGEARRITSGVAQDRQPRFSPDGARIVFISDRDGNDNLWTADAAGGSLKGLSKEQNVSFVSPAWARDGRSIVVSRDDRVWRYPLNGDAAAQVTSENNSPGQRVYRALGASESPDGRFLYYSRTVGSLMGANQYTLPMWQIARRPAAAAGTEEILTNARGSGLRPLTSPDARWLAFGTRHEGETALYVRDLHTGHHRVLAHPVEHDGQEVPRLRPSGDLLPGYAFTPDSKFIIAAYGGSIHKIEIETGSATVIPFKAEIVLEGPPAMLVSARVENGPLRARLVQSLAVSPDGRRAAFTALARLYIMDLPAGQPRLLTNVQGHAYQPAWSPDGQWLAYVTWSDKGGHLYKVRADDSMPPHQITRTPAFYREPAWSPDGTTFVLLRAPWQSRLEQQTDLRPRPFGMQIVRVASEGGDHVVIGSANGFARPYFSRDPGRVYLSSAAGLLSVQLDGSGNRVVAKVSGPSSSAAEDILPSPDGRALLAVVNKQLYVAPLPTTSGSPSEIDVGLSSSGALRLDRWGADYFHWSADGRTVYWTLGTSLFSLDVMPGNAQGFAMAEQPREVEIRVEAPRAAAEGRVLLRNARLITMRGDEVIARGDILVDGTRIAAVGPTGTFSFPSNSRIFDLAGTTIIPGLIDVHMHAWESRRGVLDLHNWALRANLAYGVTTIRDPQTTTVDMLAYQDLVETGAVIGPRIYTTGPGIGSAELPSWQATLGVLERHKRYYRTHLVKAYVAGNRQQRRWFADASRRLGLLATAEGAGDFHLDLTHALDAYSGNEHNLPVIDLYDDIAQLFARRNLTYTPTLLVGHGGPGAMDSFVSRPGLLSDSKLRRFLPPVEREAKLTRSAWYADQEQIYKRVAASAAKIISAGGRVCVGGHGVVHGLSTHWELWALQQGGLPPHEAIRAATLRGAEAIGLEQDLGSISVGKLADLVILGKNPLENIENTTSIRFVIKGGQLYDGERLAELWPVQGPPWTPWWETTRHARN